MNYHKVAIKDDKDMISISIYNQKGVDEVTGYKTDNHIVIQCFPAYFQFTQQKDNYVCHHFYVQGRRVAYDIANSFYTELTKKCGAYKDFAYNSI